MIRKFRRDGEWQKRSSHMAVASFLALLGWAEDARACYEPSAPYCSSSYMEFEDEWEYDSCVREMESYRDDVESYVSCNNDEAEQAVQEPGDKNQRALDEYEDAVASFNRRLR